MTYVIAQLSDLHIGGPNPGSGERLSEAVAEINAMAKQPDLVLLTGDNTDNGTPAEWLEVKERLEPLGANWVAISGNHDQNVSETAGHRSIQAGPLRLVLLDTSNDQFTETDANWLRNELASWPNTPTVVAVHQPPFETGIWWMDCCGLQGAEILETIVRSHKQVIKVLSGHVHRVVQTNWGGCSLWAGPSTAVAVAGDLAPYHEPAETAEPPSFSLHAFTGEAFVSHVVPFGPSAVRTEIRQTAPEFIDWVWKVQAGRASSFTES